MDWWIDCDHMHWSGAKDCACLCGSLDCEQCKPGYENEIRMDSVD